MAKTENSLNISPQQFLDQCSPNELRELELLLNSNYYQNRKNNNPQCRICGCFEGNCNKCMAITGQACHWIEDDLCSRCDYEIKQIQSFYNTKISESSLSARLVSRLRDFLSVDEKDLKIDLLQNFDFTMFSMMRGNGVVVKNELLAFCKQNKITINTKSISRRRLK